MPPTAIQAIEAELDESLETTLVHLARDAGEAILGIYRDPKADFEVDRKADDSPLTQADLASNRVIRAALEDLTPRVPILSEESAEAPWKERQAWEALWLVDPLDGTKEFLKRNGEFTVNVALVHQGLPVAGVVHAPDLGRTYYGQRDAGAWLLEGGVREPLAVALPSKGEPVRVVVSRSHLNEATQAFVDKLGPHEQVPSGSSLKFCRIAEGAAHLYPRLAPTMEWDTGAAQAVLEGAGGVVVRAEDGKPLRYNKEDLLNPHFVAAAGPGLIPA